ncbi:hypothetical protein E2C01_058985 [Portunus trituberculatus]|uniref:Uncharacterized protein n=1 Tax=Portunus trituberculatus TaxID=210409 RepID=A0A5B7H459_PORTR|nr:hypothetical protein [Portunus trituberculatus]
MQGEGRRQGRGEESVGELVSVWLGLVGGEAGGRQATSSSPHYWCLSVFSDASRVRPPHPLLAW